MLGSTELFLNSDPQLFTMHLSKQRFCDKGNCLWKTENLFQGDFNCDGYRKLDAMAKERCKVNLQKVQNGAIQYRASPWNCE